MTNYMSISGTGCLGFLKDAGDTCNLCRGTTEKNLSVTVPGELKSVKNVLGFFRISNLPYLASICQMKILGF